MRREGSRLEAPAIRDGCWVVAQSLLDMNAVTATLAIFLRRNHSRGFSSSERSSIVRCCERSAQGSDSNESLDVPFVLLPLRSIAGAATAHVRYETLSRFSTVRIVKSVVER